jgi:hypothetical protein
METIKGIIDLLRSIPGGDWFIIYTGLVTLASWIVKLTPTLADDNFLKGAVKFVGKFIAVNR